MALPKLHPIPLKLGNAKIREKEGSNTMGSSYVSRISFEGDREKLEQFQKAFEQEGFEILKSCEEHPTKEQLMEWRSNNWGVYVNLKPESRKGWFTDAGVLRQSYETYRSPPFDFLERITGMYGITCSLGAVDDYLTTFLYAEFSHGENLVYEDVDYVSELSIDFYGEAQFSEELFDFARRCLGEIDLNEEMMNTLRERMEALGIKRLLLDSDLLEKSVLTILEEMSLN